MNNLKDNQKHHTSKASISIDISEHYPTAFHVMISLYMVKA